MSSKAANTHRSESVLTTLSMEEPNGNHIDEELNLKSSLLRAVKAAYPDYHLTGSGLVALSKALDLFIRKITKESSENAKSSQVKYDDISRYIRRSNCRGISNLRDIFPARIKFSEIKNQVLNITEDTS